MNPSENPRWTALYVERNHTSNGLLQRATSSSCIFFLIFLMAAAKFLHFNFRFQAPILAHPFFLFLLLCSLPLIFSIYSVLLRRYIQPIPFLISQNQHNFFHILCFSSLTFENKLAIVDTLGAALWKTDFLSVFHNFVLMAVEVFWSLKFIFLERSFHIVFYQMPNAVSLNAELSISLN